MMMITETQFNENVGKVLIRLRHANKLTQTKVAKKLNKTFQQVQKYEKGKNATSSFRLLELATIYKTTVQNIVSEALELSNIQLSIPQEIKITEITPKIQSDNERYLEYTKAILPEVKKDEKQD